MNRGEKEKHCDIESDTVLHCKVQEPPVDVYDNEEFKCPIRKDSILLTKKRLSKELKLDPETMLAVEKRFNELRLAKQINESYESSPLDLSVTQVNGCEKNDSKSKPKRRVVVFKDELQPENANLINTPVSGSGEAKCEEEEVKIK